MRCGLALGAALVAVSLLGACRCPRIVSGERATAPRDPGMAVPSVPGRAEPGSPTHDATVMDEPDVLPSTFTTAGGGVAVVDPGAYRHDARFAHLAERWPQLVEECIALLDNRTGLQFRDGPPVSVVLIPLRDESLAHRVETRIVDGKRQAVVNVNAEPIVAGVRTPETAITRALAEAVFEIVALRHDPVAPWIVALAASLASDDLDTELTQIQRDLVLKHRTEARVDSGDASAAFVTGRAVHALLIDRDQLGDGRKLLRFAAEGDDAEWMLTRLLREADAGWVGPARNALYERLRALDRAPWQRLLEAEEALRSTGRGGLESTLTPPVPTEIAGDAKLLRAEAAIAEGAWGAARKILASLTPEERFGVRDPARALALEVEAAARPDGDPIRARELMRRLDLDFPRSDARRELRATNPLLGSGDDPRAWLRQVREHIARSGTADVDLATIERTLRVLLLDHRAGAAARLVDAMGARSEAPELEDVITFVNDSEAEPNEAAVAAGERRLERWLRSPSDATWADVVDTGRAVFRPALTRVPDASAATRARMIGVMLEVSGASDSVRALAPVWRDEPRWAAGDLDHIAGLVDSRVLRRVLSFIPAEQLTRAAIVRLWRDASFAMDAEWLDANPRFLREVRDASYMSRRGALQRAVDAAQVTPELIGRFALDESPLMRAEAVRIAGEEGFLAIAATGLRDESSRVQSEAVRALAAGDPIGARPHLLALLRSNAEPEVRVAAAGALASLAPKDPEVLDALIAMQASEEPALQDGAGRALLSMPKGPTAFGLVKAMRAALAQRPVPRPVVARYVLIFQRLSGTDLRFEPTMDAEGLKATADAMLRWARHRRELVSQGLVPVVESAGR